MTYPANKPWLPIFELFGIPLLMRRLDYSKNWLEQLRSGRKSPSPKFRRRAVRLLRLPETALFGDDHRRERNSSHARPHQKSGTGDRHRR